MATMVMVRTECCETFKTRGTRCANCPNLPENIAAAEDFRQQLQSHSFGRRGTYSAACASVANPAENLVQLG